MVLARDLSPQALAGPSDCSAGGGLQDRPFRFGQTGRGAFASITPALEATEALQPALISADFIAEWLPGKNVRWQEPPRIFP